MKKIIFIIPLILMLSLVGVNAYVTNNVNLPVYESWLQKIFSPFTGNWEVTSGTTNLGGMGCLYIEKEDQTYCPIYGNTGTQSAYSFMAAYPINTASCKSFTGTNHYPAEKSLIESQNAGFTSCSWSQSTDMPEIWAYCCLGTGGTTTQTCSRSNIDNGYGLNGCAVDQCSRTYTEVNCVVTKTCGYSNTCNGVAPGGNNGGTPTGTCSWINPLACPKCTASTIVTCPDGTKKTTHSHYADYGVCIPTGQSCGGNCIYNSECADDKKCGSDGNCVAVTCSSGQTVSNHACTSTCAGANKGNSYCTGNTLSLWSNTDCRYYSAPCPSNFPVCTTLSTGTNSLTGFAECKETTIIQTQCSDYTSESTCPNTCSWNAGGWFSDAKCETKTISPSTGFPKTVTRLTISVIAANSAQEKVINAYLGIDPVGINQDTYLSGLTKNELSEWGAYWTKKFKDVGLDTAIILAQVDKYSGTIVLPGGNTTVVVDKRTQLSLTETEWNEATPTVVIASSCDVVDSCMVRENHTIKCLYTAEVDARNKATFDTTKSDVCKQGSLNIPKITNIIIKYVTSVDMCALASGDYYKGTCRATPIEPAGGFCSFMESWAPQKLFTNDKCSNGLYLILIVAGAFLLLPKLLGGK